MPEVTPEFAFGISYSLAKLVLCRDRTMQLYYTLPLVLFLLLVTSSFGNIPKLKVNRISRSSLHAFTISLGSKMVPEKSQTRRDYGTKPVVMKAVANKSVVKKAVVKKAVAHKKWGVDDTHEAEYWFDARIHTLGNVGLTGGLHAASAAFATKLIDVKAYNGVDVRQQVSTVEVNRMRGGHSEGSVILQVCCFYLFFLLQVANELFKTVRKGKARVVDLCCGVGTSTRALCEAFPDAEAVVGVDTSAEMIAMARYLTNHLSFFKPVVTKCDAAVSAGYIASKGKGTTINQATRSAVEYARVNAEDTKLPGKSFDLVTIMYAFHEVPIQGREKMLREARRLLNAGGTLAVIDISTDYKPSYSMLLGEPYVLEYQSNIQSQLRNLQGFFRPEYKVLVPGHVSMWLLKRGPIAV
jgi:ubiquinone/menaquinone biosynthesis C-methylase UbiE